MRGGKAVHTCPGGCGNRDIPDRLFACPTDWYRLPEALQNAILRARRGSDEHWQAMHEAHQWYIDQRPAKVEAST